MKCTNTKKLRVTTSAGAHLYVKSKIEWSTRESGTSYRRPSELQRELWKLLPNHNTQSMWWGTQSVTPYGRTTTTTDHWKATLPDSLNTFYSQSDRLNTGTPSEAPVISFTPQSATPGQQQNICYAAFPGLQFCFQHFPDKHTSKLSDMESRLQPATGSWILTVRIQQRLLAAEENRTGVLASQPGLQRTDREHPHCTHHCLQC